MKIENPERVNELLYEKKPLRDRAYPYVVGGACVIATALLIIMFYLKEVS